MRLQRAANTTQEHFSKLYGVDSTVLALDIEFKILGSERKLLFKQVRP